jgi:hypothetical protein
LYVSFSGGKAVTTQLVRRVLRPQNLSAILGMGLLAVASVGFIGGAIVGAAVPFGVELMAAAVGIAGGTAAVLKSD